MRWRCPPRTRADSGARTPVEADLLEERRDPPPDVRSRGQPMDLDPFGHRCADGHARVEAAVGVLEDDLHPATQPAERGPVEGEHVRALEQRVTARRLLQPQDRPADRGLPQPLSPTGPGSRPGRLRTTRRRRRARVERRPEQAAGGVVLDEVADLEEWGHSDVRPARLTRSRVILSAAKEPCFKACPLRFAQGDSRPGLQAARHPISLRQPAPHPVSGPTAAARAAARSCRSLRTARPKPAARGPRDGRRHGAADRREPLHRPR